MAAFFLFYILHCSFPLLIWWMPPDLPSSFSGASLPLILPPKGVTFQRPGRGVFRYKNTHLITVSDNSPSVVRKATVWRHQALKRTDSVPASWDKHVQLGISEPLPRECDRKGGEECGEEWVHACLSVCALCVCVCACTSHWNRMTGSALWGRKAPWAPPLWVASWVV